VVYEHSQEEALAIIGTALDAGAGKVAGQPDSEDFFSRLNTILCTVGVGALQKEGGSA
jgi:hypothetical protein